MSNLRWKQERLRLLVCGIRKDRGRLQRCLTTPVGAVAFLARSARVGVPMVSLTFPKVDRDYAPNLARPVLIAAITREQAGDLIGSGVRLREGVRRQLFSMCDWHNCLPVKTKQRGPRQLLAALVKAKVIDDEDRQLIEDAIVCGNRAAHCEHVDRSYLRGSLSLMFCVLDTFPCGDDRIRGVPLNADGIYHLCDHRADDDGGDDEDDGADWWKKGGVPV